MRPALHMSKKVAILQSNYIPWKGYFDLINMVDLFMFYDDRQYTTRDWRNGNKMKTPYGSLGLTIPCRNNTKRQICEVELNDHAWQEKHWSYIKECYRKTSYFDLYKPFVENFYLGRIWTNLSDLNHTFIRTLSKQILGVNTIFEDSRKFNLQVKKGERILELLVKSNATSYLSGLAAKDYLIEKYFDKLGIGMDEL